MYPEIIKRASNALVLYSVLTSRSIPHRGGKDMQRIADEIGYLKNRIPNMVLVLTVRRLTASQDNMQTHFLSNWHIWRNMFQALAN